MPTFTTNFGLSKPLVNSATDQDLWGTELNADIDSLDGLLLTALNFTTSSQTSSFNVTAMTAASTTTGSNKVAFMCDATGGAITASLPAAASAGSGFWCAFKKIDVSGNSVTIQGHISETIDGSNTLALTSQYQWVLLVCDGTGWNVLSITAPVVSGVLKSVKSQVFTSSGTYTPSSGMVFCIAEVQASGGSGGGSGGGTCGAGGGAGAYSKSYFTAATIGSSQTVTINAAGAAASSGSNGNGGGTASFGALIVCNGGNGGAADLGTRQVGGSGGAATTPGNILAVNGQQGFGSITLTNGILGGGGNSILGQGGQPSSTSGAGQAGTGYGSGGSGNANGSGNTGAGAPGLVTVLEFCTS